MKTRCVRRRTGIFLAAAAAVAAVILAVVLLCGTNHRAAAKGDLDEILNYTITIDVNSDGTLSMLYHIEWKVLDSTSEGPLEWVHVGVGNKHFTKLTKLTSNIKKISTYQSSSVRIDFDRKYKAGEVVVFEFSLVQDYMYQMNMLTEGETVYEFTPGWFDDCKVDKLVIRWNADKVESWSPSCELGDDGYLTWTSSLKKG